MTMIIEGRKAACIGWTNEGTLLFADDSEYIVEQLLGNGPPPTDLIAHTKRPLLEIAGLRKENGNYLLNEDPLERWVRAVMGPRLGRQRGIPETHRSPWAMYKALKRTKAADLPEKFFRYAMLVGELKQCDVEPQGVAWFCGDDEPVLLKTFRRLAKPTGGMVPAQLKTFEVATAVAEAIKPELAQVGNRVREAEARAHKAESAGGATLQEALGKWMRFEPEGARTETKARIQKAVHMYCTDPKDRSLAVIATAFKVNRGTVSKWFKQFTEETGFPVVKYERHESVMGRLKAEAKGGLPAKPKRGESNGTWNRE